MYYYPQIATKYILISYIKTYFNYEIYLRQNNSNTSEFRAQCYMSSLLYCRI